MDARDLQLNALLEVTQAINNNLSEEELYRVYKFTLLGDLKVPKMALFVKEKSWECKAHFGTDCQGKILFRDEFDGLKSELPLNSSHGPFAEFERAIPILHKDKLLAVVFLGHVKDVTFLQALTNIIIVAIENKKMAREQLAQEAYKKEMEIAKKVQNFLFPKTLPDSRNLKVEAVYLPHHDVGGDYYDYIKIDEDRFLIGVADVSGKGVPAALLMSNFQATLHALIRKSQDIREIIAELNRATFKSGNGENFITFFVGIYNFRNQTLEYVNCGHNPLFLVTHGQIIHLDKGTTVLGMFEPLPFMESGQVENLDDFVFFGYTDGLTETFNADGEQFGEERLQKLVLEQNGDLKFLHTLLLQELEKFKGDLPYHDDITFISCQVKNKS
jgi:phosphoserine phosphatase RsbU/P